MRRAAWAFVLVLAACGGLEDLTAIDPSEGAYARSTVVGINYPANALPVGAPIGDLVAAWGIYAEANDLPQLVETSRDGDVVTYVAESTTSGVALDVIATSDLITIAQLQVIDAAGEGDEQAAVDTLREFLAMMGVANADAVLESLTLVSTEALFLERAESTAVSGEVTRTVYVASNEDTILLGVTG